MITNTYRPKLFADVVGQESEVAVIKTILQKGWRPSAIMLAGGFGTGKTTLARLIARAMLCDNRQGVEPCGVCQSCVSMDRDNNASYIEIDAASHGLVADIRSLKDEAAYKAVGGKAKIITLDESHMISVQGQNSMLKVLEEGQDGLLFMFATTDVEKMLPTIRSRCVVLNLKLLTAAEIAFRLKTVADALGAKYEDKALRIIATYVRGHMRDALMMLEQMTQIASEITEELVRTHLRLDKTVELYEFLVERDKAKIVTKVEQLLCSYSPGDLTESLGQVLIDVYKHHLGVGDYSQVDSAWLKKVGEAQGLETVLEKAERVIGLNTDYASISYGIASITRVFEGATTATVTPSRGPVPGGAQQAPVPSAFRKPGK